MLTQLLADATGGLDVAGVAPAISAIMSIGFATWFAYYTTTTTLPNQQKMHREQLKEVQDSFSASLKEIIGEMRAEREAFDRWKMAGR